MYIIKRYIIYYTLSLHVIKIVLKIYFRYDIFIQCMYPNRIFESEIKRIFIVAYQSTDGKTTFAKMIVLEIK